VGTDDPIPVDEAAAIEQYDRLVKFIVARIFGWAYHYDGSRGISRDDLLQVGYMAVLEAYRRYQRLADSSRRLYTMVFSCVKHRVNTYVNYNLTVLSGVKRSHRTLRSTQPYRCAAYASAMSYVTFSELEEVRTNLPDGEADVPEDFEPIDPRDWIEEIDHQDTVDFLIARLKQHLSAEEFARLWRYHVNHESTGDLAADSSVGQEEVRRQMHKLMIKAAGILAPYRDLYDFKRGDLL